MSSKRLFATLAQPRIFGWLLFALAATQSWWYALYGFGGSDEGQILVSASRILRGAVFYQDIDAYPFPGSNYLLALAMAIFGEHMTVARSLAGMVYVGIVVTLYFTSLRLLDEKRAAIFGVSLLGCKMLAWPAYTSYFYWDVSLLAASVATLLLLGLLDPKVTSAGSSERARLLGMGAATGFAFISKQSIGIYLGMAITAVLVLRHIAEPRGAKNEGADEPSGLRAIFAPFGPLILGFSAVVLPMVLYFAAKGLLGQMIYSGLIRPFTDYADTSGISFSKPLRWWEFGELQGKKLFFYYPVVYWRVLSKQLIPGSPEAFTTYWVIGEVFIRWVYTSLPLIFGTAAFICARSWSKLSDRTNLRFVAVTLIAAAITASAFPRADFTHIIGIYSIVLLLMFACLGRLAGLDGEATSKTRFYRKFELAVATVFALTFFGFSYAHHTAMTTHIVLPTADLMVLPQDGYYASVVKYVRDEIPEDTPFFIYGHEAHYYFLTQRFSSWKFSQLYPGQDGGDDGQALTDMLKKAPPKVIIQGFLNFPGLPNLQNYTPILNDYLRANYELDERVFERYPPVTGGHPSPYWIQMKRLKTGDALQ